MVERITDPHKPVQFSPGCYRIPDGHVVPNPPRPDVPQPESLPAGYYPPRRGGVVATIVICALIVFALMVAGIAGVFR